MNDKKKTGSYYTPSSLAEFMVKHVFSHFKHKRSIEILEPSFGEGEFFRAINTFNTKKKIHLTGIEIDQCAFDKAQDNKDFHQNFDLELINDDYLEFHFNSDKKFDLVIGNPPYIKRNYLSENQIELCHKILALNPNYNGFSIKNLWAAFLVSAISKLKENGVLAFVLPTEFLQVSFGVELRKLVEESFERVEIITFKELIFSDTGAVDQDTIVLIAQKKSADKGVFFHQIDILSNLSYTDISPPVKFNSFKEDAFLKWTHHILSSDEINLLSNLKNNIKTIADHAKSMPGIVTAANDFFIVSDSDLTKYQLHQYAKPIIKGGPYVNGKVTFDSADFNKLKEKDFSCFFLQFDEAPLSNQPYNVREYLDLGIQKDIHTRYKCKIRKEWFIVPNIATQGEAFFFKRSFRYPKLIKNIANTHVTDSAYKIFPKNGYNIDSIIYSFYNVLTFIYAELYGRYLGGGVLELTPNEFKNLPIPYVDIDHQAFQDFSLYFEAADNIESVLDRNKLDIFKQSGLNIDNEIYSKLSSIRQKLVSRRIR